MPRFAAATTRFTLFLLMLGVAWGQPLAAQAAGPILPQPATATTTTTENFPIRVGNRVVLTIREPFGAITIQERGAIVQSRVDQVLMHHPYLKASDVKLVRDAGSPVIYWGQFPIIAVDEAHAKANNFSSADLLASAWANNLREAVSEFLAAKKLPERALYRNVREGDFVYRRTVTTLDRPLELRNTHFVFSPAAFAYGAGEKLKPQEGFVVFVRKEAGNQPDSIFLGNPEATFTEYVRIKPEDNAQ